MALRHTSPLLQMTDIETNQSKISNIKSKKILSDSTNNELGNSQTSSESSSIDNGSAAAQRHRRPRGYHPLTLDTIRRYKNAIKCRNNFTTNCPDNERITIDIDLLNDIQSFQQGNIHLQPRDNQLKSQQARLQRSIYNSKQTPLIPFIIDTEFPSLFESSSSSKQDDVLCNVLTLLNNIDEEHSFFEQFRI